MKVTISSVSGKLVMILPKKATQEQILAVKLAISPVRQYTTLDNRTAFVMAESNNLDWG